MPPVKTTREKILDAIDARLKTITVVNGYRNTVAVVERVVKDWDTSGGADARPWLGFMPIEDTVTYQPFGEMRREMGISVVGHISAGDAATRNERLCDLLRDVRFAMNVDPTLGGACMMITLRSEQADDGDPDTIDSRGGGGSFVQNWAATYFENVSEA